MCSTTLKHHFSAIDDLAARLHEQGVRVPLTHDARDNRVRAI